MEILTTKYLKAGIRYEGIQRVEELPVPKDALREALLNAVVHKDYSSGSPIQISVYEEKLMIWNTGSLPESWTKKTLLGKHSSQPFNPDIANAFFRAGEIEAWGRGIERILTVCREAKIPTPEINLESTGLWVVFPFSRGKDKTTQETTQEMILKMMREKPSITRKELSGILQITPDGVKYHLDILRKNGVIRHTGPTKAGKWEILK